MSHYYINKEIKQLEKFDELSDILLPFDFSETVQISSLALLKMLRHGRAGIPVEVMGLIIGEYTENSTCISINDVFAMPQTGTGVSVEAIDPAFQTKMLDMLRQINVLDTIIGWYHSHPGFGCWLSGVDINTQHSFEQLNQRSIAIVIDPIQSVKGKIIIDAFRLYPVYTRGQEIRDITCIQGLVNNPILSKDEHGLNKYYYSLNIAFRITFLEKATFSLLYEKDWSNHFLPIESVNKIFKKNYLNIYKDIILLIKKISIDLIKFPINISIKNTQKIELLNIKLKKKLLFVVEKTILNCIKKIIIQQTFT
nr:26S proteasome regulatory subunit [Cryptomonas curvata]|mmetsp:Transcript_23773/g.49711  ORF Transcript_23773/g.49711 Transcript_23773/m.49711 type:complete len:310 (-) Transcript_23773:4951-5880(-)